MVFSDKEKKAIYKYYKYKNEYENERREKIDKIRKKNKIKGVLRLAPDINESKAMRYYIGDHLFIVDKVSLRKAFGRKTFPSHNFRGKVKSKKAFFGLWCFL